MLFGSIKRELEASGISSLVIIPDDDLFGIPFAALTTPGSGRLLVDDYAVMVSPSASLFARATLQNAVNAGNREPFYALVVADPKIDEAVWPRLSDLSSAYREGAFIKELFPANSEFLAGIDATVPALRSHLINKSWLHFSGHAMAVSRRPLDSYLLLSQSKLSSGRLTAKELLGWDLGKLHGVVLSACSSAASSRESWSGAMALARPFLAAGVPMVIGSLWDVEDQDSSLFFQDFYRGVASHGLVFKAFHEAQLSALARARKSNLHRGAWSAFQLLGGPDGPAN
jgi:CHAT domain-containing protein